MMIEWNEFYKWVKDQRILYSKDYSKNGDLVEFYVSGIGRTGRIIVIVNDDEIYNGECFGDAADAYNDTLSR